MEDFGYKKNTNSDNKNIFLAKKMFLISATLLSLSAFFYITLNAYYFINGNNKEIETIKGPESPIRVYENDDYNQKNDRIINRSIYDDIFGNRKEIIREDIKIKKNSEPPSPPKTDNIISGDSNIETASPTLSSDYLDKIEETQNEEEEKNNIRKIQIAENLKNNTRNTEDYPAPSMQQQTPKTKTTPRKRSSIKVQISAMTSKENCEEYLYKLKKLYPEVFSGTKHYIQEADLGRRGIFYRLQIGDFANQIQAEEFCDDFISQTRKSNSECIIVE